MSATEGADNVSDQFINDQRFACAPERGKIWRLHSSDRCSATRGSSAGLGGWTQRQQSKYAANSTAIGRDEFAPLSTVGAGGCAGQYTAAINDNFTQANTASGVGLGFNATGAAAQVVGLTAQQVASDASAASFTALSVGLAGTAFYGTSPLPNFEGIPFSVDAAVAAGVLAGTSTVQAVALAANIVGAGATVGGVASQIAGQVFTTNAVNLTSYAASLPSCEQTNTGTSAVPPGQGALNVSGDSFFNGNVGVTGNVNIGNNFTASKLLATRGISAYNGAIVIGTPDLTTYFSGITIGGGAIAGAGRTPAVVQLQGSVKRAYEGTAIAIAMGGAYLPEGKIYAISANYGTFRNQNAFAATGAVRVADFAYLNGAIGAGLDRGGVGGRAGVTFAW